jgi:hypothetical protein
MPTATDERILQEADGLFARRTRGLNTLAVLNDHIAKLSTEARIIAEDLSADALLENYLRALATPGATVPPSGGNQPPYPNSLPVRPGTNRMKAIKHFTRWDSSGATDQDVINSPIPLVTLQWWNVSNHVNISAQRAAVGKETGRYENFDRINPSDSSTWGQTFGGVVVNGSAPYFGPYDPVYGAYVVVDGDHPGWLAVIEFKVQRCIDQNCTIIYLDDAAGYQIQGRPTIARIEDNMGCLTYGRQYGDARISNMAIIPNTDWSIVAYSLRSPDLQDNMMDDEDPRPYDPGVTARSPYRGTWLRDSDGFCRESAFWTDSSAAAGEYRRILETDWFIFLRQSVLYDRWVGGLEYPPNYAEGQTVWDYYRTQTVPLTNPALRLYDGLGVNIAGGVNPQLNSVFSPQFY